MNYQIEPVTKESTAGIIAKQLRAAIMAGTLRPGAQLGEAELATRLRISRGPLREAMQRLVQEGLLRSEPHRGLFVMDIAPGDVQDIYMARTAIEGAALRRIVRSRRSDAVAQLDNALEAMNAAAHDGDLDAIANADLQFHETLVTAAGSPRLIRMAGTLIVETHICLTALKPTFAQGHERVAEHRRIVEAITSGDESTAIELLELHMQDAIVQLAPGSSLFTGPSTERGEPTKTLP